MLNKKLGWTTNDNELDECVFLKVKTTAHISVPQNIISPLYGMMVAQVGDSILVGENITTNFTLNSKTRWVVSEQVEIVVAEPPVTFLGFEHSRHSNHIIIGPACYTESVASVRPPRYAFIRNYR